MSVYPIPTNFTGLIEPRVMKSAIFSSTVTLASSASAYSLQGYIGAGSIITSAYLVSPTGATGLGGFSYTVSLSGSAATLTGTVASFSGAALIYPGQYLATPVGQDSIVTLISNTGSATTVIPSVLLTYLS